MPKNYIKLPTKINFNEQPLTSYFEGNGTTDNSNEYSKPDVFSKM